MGRQAPADDDAIFHFPPPMLAGCACAALSLVALLAATPSLRAVDEPLPRNLALVETTGKSTLNEFAGATPLQWSVRMADSTVARRGEKLAFKPGGGKWDYAAGLFTLSLLKLNEQVNDPRYVQFVEKTIGSFIASDGNIQGYKAAEYQLDALNPGKTVLALWQLTKEERYQKCAALLRKQLDTQPRTSEGGFWHKQRYPRQMWLDGLYMSAPFYAQYTELHGGPAADFDDVAKQFRLIQQHLYDPASGLFYHGWDESKEQDWANKTTGASSNFWGRAIGWYGMGLADVLDFMPAEHPARPELLAAWQQLAAGVVKHQDPASGLWWQVMDQGGREGNYLEATASSMFVYTLAKGINRGCLKRDYLPATLKAYRGLVEKLVRTDPNGQVSLTQCCSVAGLGSYGHPRDGSFKYYVSEPIVENDLKGVGPFILAGLEMQRLLGLPMASTPAAKAAPPVTLKNSTAPEWAQMPEILARIKAPVFRAREFRIASFGATADGQTDSTEAIGKAIEACAKAGGGRVIVPAGEFLTGPIHLKSNVEFHLEDGATLKFKTEPKAYLPSVLTRFEGMECYNYSPLIYACEQENVAVTGKGVLDGQASDQNWWLRKGKKGTGDKPAQTQKAARDRLIKMVDQNVPVEQRQFGEGDFLRPSFIETYRCRNVLLEGVRVRNSPMWELHPALCTNVIVRGIDILSHGPNNDGCDPECCRDVLIEDCVFDTGDDCIAIKSGRNNDGRRVGLPSENLIIRHCTMKDGHGGVVIGSEVSGGCRNVFAEDCKMDSPRLDRALRLKSNAVRGGTIENIFMRNVAVGRLADAVLQIDFVYEEGASGPFKPAARNIVMEGVTVSNTPRVLNVVGFPGAEINGVRLYNCIFKNVARPDVVKEADVKLVDCVVERKEQGTEVRPRRDR
jgi:unsaturated rhamnogalacturonyl hydrolase